MAKKVQPMWSKEAQLKLKRDNMWQPLQDFLWETNFISWAVEWAIDWRYAGTKVKLVDWLKANTNSVPSKVVGDLADLKNLPKTDGLARQCLMYVKRNITYTSDTDIWKVSDKWQTPSETWVSGKGDCEDGAILLYAILKFVGFTDNQVWLVASDVVGGGHAYVVYKSDNGQEYPLDWCYWADKSIKMDTIYENREEYYFGEREWFRLNAKGSWTGNPTK